MSGGVTHIMNVRSNHAPNPLLFQTIMFMLALVQFAIGPNIPTIAARFNLPETHLGIAFTFQFSGALLILLIGAALVRRFGHKINMVSSVLTFVVASFLVPLASSLWQLCLVLFFLGAASANTQVIIFALVEIVYGEESGRQQNLVGATFAMGAVTGPLFTSIIGAAIGWGTVFWTGAAIGLPLLFWLFKTPLTIPHSPREAGTSRGRNTWFWALTAALIFYLAGESIVNSWVSTYLKEALKAPLIWQGVGLSAFWVGMASGRFASSKVVQRIRPATLIYFYGIGAALTTALAVQFKGVAVTTLMFGVAGIFFGGIVPSIISLLAQQPHGTDRMHLFFAFGQLGPILFPFLAGRVADALSFYHAFLLPVPVLLLMLVMIAIFFSLIERRKEDERA